MRVLPILFNTDMVRAILENGKTATRRVVKFRPGQNPQWTGYVPDGPTLYGSNNIPAAKAPYRPGDILYVRETWTQVPDGGYVYKASVECPDAWKGTWYPSIHMPKEAARLFLRVKDVRVERLQDITDEDIVAEGLEIGCYFEDLWDSTVKPADRDRYGWASNPWVWVVEFERISKEAALKGGDG